MALGNNGHGKQEVFSCSADGSVRYFIVVIIEGYSTSVLYDYCLIVAQGARCILQTMYSTKVPCILCIHP